jgi:hypothetical protein
MKTKTFEVLMKTKTIEVLMKTKTFEVLKTSKVKFKLRKMLYFVLGTLYIVLL